MSSKMIATANPSLHLLPKPNQSQKPNICSLSFSSHVSKSRIPTGISSGPRMAQATAQPESALYAPADSKETLYELLGISEAVSSFSDIKKAYKQMARKYHPDVSPPERVDENTRRFIMVHEAYETLSNPKTKALYDRDLAGGLGFSFSTRNKSYDQETEEKEHWRSTWESQLDGLNRRDSGKNMSWGPRMRSQR